jgi:hypothetical protein
LDADSLKFIFAQPFTDIYGVFNLWALKAAIIVNPLTLPFPKNVGNGK